MPTPAGDMPVELSVVGDFQSDVNGHSSITSVSAFAHSRQTG
jgi:hypothetical protein